MDRIKSGFSVVTSTAVPQEASLTDIVTRIDLKEKDDTWVSVLHQAANLDNDRTQYQIIIAERDYDVRSNVKFLQAIYLNALSL